MIEGSFDLALRNSAFEDSSLKGRKLANDTRVLCASPDYPEEYGVPEHPEELKTHQLIGFKDDAPRLLIGANGEPAEFNPREAGNRLMVDDGLSQKMATIAGVGVNGSTGEGGTRVE